MPGQRLISRGAFLDKDLDESAGLRWAFPWEAALASGQLDRHIADPLGLPGLEDDILREIVALVEQAQCGNPILYRGAVFVLDHLAGSSLSGHFAGNLGRFGIGSFAAATGRQREGREQRQQDGKELAGAHQASGDQASYAVS
mgnify:CR=1 FL=1